MHMECSPPHFVVVIVWCFFFPSWKQRGCSFPAIAEPFVGRLLLATVHSPAQVNESSKFLKEERYSVAVPPPPPPFTIIRFKKKRNVRVSQTAESNTLNITSRWLKRWWVVCLQQRPTRSVPPAYIFFSPPFFFFCFQNNFFLCCFDRLVCGFIKGLGLSTTHHVKKKKDTHT